MTIDHEDIARDPALPARAGEPALALPDEARVVALVARHLAGPDAPRPCAAVCTYARWKPGVSLTACFRVGFDDGLERLVTLKRYLGDKAAQLEASYAPDEYARAAAAPLSAAALVGEEGLALHVFPADRVLDGSARALTIKRTAHLVDRSGALAPWVVRERASSVELVRYKPERRAVLRLELKLRGPEGAREARRLGARVLGPETARRVAARRRDVLEREGAPRAPRLIAHDERPGILLEEWLDLSDAPRALERQLGAAGALLARLHALRAPGGALAADRRDGLAPLFALDDALLAEARRVPEAPVRAGAVWVHGDFHLGQAGALRGGGEALLDLDELRPGEGVEDLASVLADELGRAPERTLDALAAPLLEGYAGAGGAPPERAALAAFVADGLVRRAAAAVRRLEQGAVERARGLVARARELSEPRA